MTRRAGLLALLLGSTVLAACGGPSAVPPSATGSLTRLDTTTADPSFTGPSGRPKAGGEKAPATTERETVADLVGFSSPSGNVGCYLDPTTVRCDIQDRSWTPPPRPPDCEFDYGQGIDLSVGQAPSFVCAGDTALGGGTSLAYGKSITAGQLTCVSTEAGITCRDSTTTHGFTIAREAFRLF